MVEKIKAWLETPAGKKVAVVLAVLAGLLMIWTLKNQFGASEVSKLTTDRVFIDADNGKPFNYTVKIGEDEPVVSPFTGKNSGYEAEKCYWTKEGKSKDEPTYVLLNARIKKPGPTYCPDCGRLVVAHNPGPEVGMSPPPTASESKGK